MLRSNRFNMDYIEKVARGESLDIEEAKKVSVEIFEKATDAQIGGILTGLRVKGETDGEIAGFAKGMKKKARSISPDVENIIDIVGTGGDKYDTINVSTASSIVAASTGLNVAKHGNYSVSSKTGSADVLEQLGIKIGADPPEVEDTIEKIGIGFMLAPVFHPAMERVIEPRQELGIRTIFNILGPLTNPADADTLLIGVYSEELVRTISQVLKIMDKNALVVHGSGIDEIALHGETKIAELRNGEIEKYTIKPEEIGLNRNDIKKVKGGSPKENAEILEKIFKGEEKGPKRDIVLANTGAALYISNKAKTIEDGVKKAKKAIERGDTIKKLEQLQTTQ